MKHFVHELQEAIAASIMAGGIMQKTRAEGLEIQSKGQSFDLVTQADKAVEQAVVSHLRSHFPNYDVIAEEHDWGASGSRFQWVIDPIDGTTNYIREYPQYSCSIALCVDGRPEVGVVYAPFTDELYYAVRGEGAWLRRGASERQIHVTGATSLVDAMLITGFYYDRGPRMQHTLDCLGAFMRLGCQGVRRFGAASIDLCYVAAGRADTYWELELNAWDFAAGWIIAEEAGALVSDMRGHPLPIGPSSILATTPGLKPAVLEVIAQGFPA